MSLCGANYDHRWLRCPCLLKCTEQSFGPVGITRGPLPGRLLDLRSTLLPLRRRRGSELMFELLLCAGVLHHQKLAAGRVDVSRACANNPGNKVCTLHRLHVPHLYFGLAVSSPGLRPPVQTGSDGLPAVSLKESLSPRLLSVFMAPFVNCRRK